jgi:hypothetical protein
MDAYPDAKLVNNVLLTSTEPIVGGIFCVMFGMITSVGLSNLQVRMLGFLKHVCQKLPFISFKQEKRIWYNIGFQKNSRYFPADTGQNSPKIVILSLTAPGADVMVTTFCR